MAPLPEAQAPDPNAGATLEQRMAREQLASVYYTYNATFIARVGFILVFSGFIYLQLGNPWVLPFVLVHLALYLHAYFTPRWTPQTPVDQNAYWQRKITRLVIALGLVDALGPWLFVPAGNVPLTAVLAVVLMGNCARAAQSLRAMRGALLGQTLPPMLSFIVALLCQRDSLQAFLALFSLVYLVMMLRVATRENRVLSDAWRLRFENEALARRLAEQVERTQRASEEKTRFLATASHDLRQPLHAIALFGAALENEVRGRPESHNAERLMRAVHSLGHSLDTMLDVSRLDAGVVMPGREAVSVDALFLMLNHTFASVAEQKDLGLRLRASGLWVDSDPKLLHRMLSNLIDNALKYTARGGVVVAARSRSGAVWIEVHDTGIGIPKTQLGRIFEEFYQVNNPGRDRSRGMGIGLSIVQRLSRLLDHPVQVASRPGRGTSFRVILPALSMPVPGELPCAGVGDAPAAALPPEGTRVLLIDDESEIREALVGLLQGHGIHAQAVADGRAAAHALGVARAERQPFDVLVSDYRLADGVDGLALALQLREHFDPDLRVLMVTGETAPERLQEVREARVPVLFKPVQSERLLMVLGRLVAGQGSDAQTDWARVPAG